MKPYQILPLRYEKFSEDKTLLTNEVGEFLFVSPDQFQDLLTYNLKADIDIFLDLKAKHFVTDTDLLPAINMLATKYRTKKGFLKDFTSLHMVVPTLQCNSKCIYCQVSSKDAKFTNYRMNEDTAKKVVDLIFQSPSPTIKIEFQGGEPLMAFETVKYIIEYAEKLNGNYHKSLQFVICTNLILLTNQHLRFFKDHDVFISTSLDGPKDIQDKNRPLRNGDSAYDGLIRNLDLVRRELEYHRVSALMTVTLNNLYRLNEVVDEYIRQDFASIFIRPINPYGLARKDQIAGSYSIEEFIKMYMAAFDYIISLNLSGIFFSEEYALILLKNILTPFSSGFVDLQSPAGAAVSCVVYNYDGNVYVSDEGRMLAEMGDQRFLMGNVNENSYEELFFNDRIVDLVRWSIIESLPICSSCAFNPYCGIDAVRNYSAQGDVVVNITNSESCRKNKEIFKLLFSLIDKGHPKIIDVFWSWLTNRRLRTVSMVEA